MTNETIKYHIYDVSTTKARITAQPLTLEEIRNAFGPIQKLEAKGFRVLKAVKEVKHYGQAYTTSKK